MRFIQVLLKKILPIALMVFLCCEAAFIPLSGAVDSQYANAEYYDAALSHTDGVSPILRLHIVANSDSEEDQRVKLLVRDALLEKFSPATSMQQAEELVLLGGEDVLSTIKSVLLEQGFAYGAQLHFGVMSFPDRTYGEAFYPAGDYEALKIELGDAQGKNWWCVLFPPLCILDIAASDIPDTDELVFESDLLKLINDAKDNNKKEKK